MKASFIGRQRKASRGTRRFPEQNMGTQMPLIEILPSNQYKEKLKLCFYQNPICAKSMRNTVIKEYIEEERNGK